MVVALSGVVLDAYLTTDVSHSPLYAVACWRLLTWSMPTFELLFPQDPAYAEWFNEEAGLAALVFSQLIYTFLFYIALCWRAQQKRVT